MALIQSTYLSQIAGSIGGTVFSDGRSGPYARARTTPSNPNSPLQSAVRSALANATRAYSVQSAAIRATWDAYAATQSATNSIGGTISLTGQNCFVRSNTILSVAGRPQITAAPPLPGGASLMAPFSLGTTIGAPADAATQVIATIGADASWKAVTTSTLLVFTSSPQSPARSAPLGGFSFSAKIAGAASPPTTLNCPIRGGAAVATGEKIFIRMLIVDGNGEISSDTVTSVIATA